MWHGAVQPVKSRFSSIVQAILFFVIQNVHSVPPPTKDGTPSLSTSYVLSFWADKSSRLVSLPRCLSGKKVS